ncbi:siroheme synthase CysG [Pantoea sp. Mhis]|uniref:siroheme synthase CysG n=1 Tax=Pantoea sp. Mhis TaxID=2576759 RepID=UPI0013587ABC|nr:siroheme synthase CysG [Pantoea sp. Mhis]MXP56717.1 uroporphyrinogen-III C-methyltransferase [Pantoea sp. Mhis]
MNYLPIFADVNNRTVLVIGGGDIAARKIKLLHRAGANIRVVANNLGKTMQDLLNINNITWISYDFSPMQLDDVFLVVAATNNEKLNSQIFEAANARHKLINVIDRQSKCSFIFPAIVDRYPLILAISSSGTAPMLVRLLREKLEALLPNNIGKIAEIAGKWRDKVKQHYQTISERRHFWERIFNGLFPSQITKGNIKEANRILDYELKNHNCNQGEIILIGAGPGDSGLLTIRGLQLMQLADVVLYDYLVSNEVLQLVRSDAERICVGKRPGKASIQQDKINQLLIKLAQQGKRVVRLKGGDPFIFGRGAEELQAAQIAGIPFQIVPGITSAIGVTAYAGIPLTHRDYSQSVIFITGHYCMMDKKNIDWSLIARLEHTLVIYMGKLKATEITTELIKNGKDPDIPIAVISRGTYKDQKVLIGKLHQLEMLVLNVSTPILLVIGKVVEFHKKLAWFKYSDSTQFNESAIVNLT